MTPLGKVVRDIQTLFPIGAKGTISRACARLPAEHHAGGPPHGRRRGRCEASMVNDRVGTRMRPAPR